METAVASGVSMRMAADDLAIPVAAKVAAGAAEALGLQFGPGRRLTAITLEATRNAVQHAYLNRELGAIELRIEVDSSNGNGNGDGPAIHVHVRDYGSGCPLAHPQPCSKSATGRTSIVPPAWEPGQRAAQSSATTRISSGWTCGATGLQGAVRASAR